MTGFTQGDAYQLPVTLKDENGLINVDLISAVEFRFGDIRKVYPNEVTYDSDRGVFLVPLTQTDTFSLKNDPVECQARIKFQSSGDVRGTGTLSLNLQKALSKVVL